jgi:hypothetical protein
MTIPFNLISAYGLYVQFQVGCNDISTVGGGVACDVNDPISITMPTGVTFTSASGQFLTAPVPLPASLWLTLSSMAGVLLWGRGKPSRVSARVTHS